MGSLGDVEQVESWSSSSVSIPETLPAPTTALPLLSLNHVSFVCKNLAESVRFYEEVLGFVMIKRPSSFDFEGAWLFSCGIGIHLLEIEDVPVKKGKINPKDNHISFQCTDMDFLISKLKKLKIKYVTAIVEEGGILVDQLFFHDPDGYMIEICNCQNLPILPISSCPLKLPSAKPIPKDSPLSGKSQYEVHCAGEVATWMMDNLAMDMMDIAI